MNSKIMIFIFFIDQLNGEDYTRSRPRSPSPTEARSRSRSPRGYLSVRRSPELRETSPNRNLAASEAEEHRKSPASSRTTPDVKNAKIEQPPTSNGAIQNLLASIATSSSMQMFAGLQQPQLLAAFATLAAMAGNNPATQSPPVSMAAGLPGMFPQGPMADQAQALQTFAQLQSLFLLNPAAAGSMMPMQQVNNKIFNRNCLNGLKWAKKKTLIFNDLCQIGLKMDKKGLQKNLNRP